MTKQAAFREARTRRAFYIAAAFNCLEHARHLRQMGSADETEFMLQAVARHRKAAANHTAVAKAAA